MEFEFIPHRLIASRRDIEKRHSSRGLPSGRLMRTGELEKLVKEVAGLKKSLLKARAYVLSTRDIYLISGYLPHNFYDVNLENLFEVYKLMADARCAEFMLLEWQDAFNNKPCNLFMRELCYTDSIMNGVLKKHDISQNEFSQVLSATVVEMDFVQMVRRHSSEDLRLDSRFRLFDFSTTSKLYQESELIFYTVCSKREYETISEEELIVIIQKYSVVYLKRFLEQYLSVYSLNELRKKIDLLKYLDRELGDKDSKKYHYCFDGMDPRLVTKYLDWINTYKVDSYFGFDERSRFWKRYHFVSVSKYSHSNAVIMEFERFYAIEFLGRAMGPIYIYRKHEFESVVSGWLGSNNNAELRSKLYNTKNYYDRIPHSGYWQGTVHSKLIRDNITSEIIN